MGLSLQISGARMRELKFRGYDFATKKIESWDIIDEYDSMAWYFNNMSWYFNNTSNVVLMQYTGLKDKHGKEIYEGDICICDNEEADNTPFLVPEMKVCNFEAFLYFVDDDFKVGENQYSNLKIIGNKYENPELRLRLKRMNETNFEWNVWFTKDCRMETSEIYEKHPDKIYLLYSGLKDNNGKGKKIFEGDIVRIHGYGLRLVEFPFIELYAAVMENDIGEILGNIYENPELMEGLKE